MNQIAIGLWTDGQGNRTVRLYGGPPEKRESPKDLNGLVSAEIAVRSASKKRPIKFATGSPQFRSGIWRVWSPTKTGDIYVMPQSNESFGKISLHASGDWRFQILNERLDHPQIHFVKHPDSRTRILDQWQRPADVVDGWTDALTVLIPHDDITRVPNDDTSPSAVPRWMSPPLPQWCSRYRLYIVKDDAPTLCMDWPDDWNRHRVTLIGAYRTVVGETVLVTHDHMMMSKENRESLRHYRHKVASELPKDFDTNAVTGPRHIAQKIEGPEEHRVFLDLATLPMRQQPPL